MTLEELGELDGHIQWMLAGLEAPDEVEDQVARRLRDDLLEESRAQYAAGARAAARALQMVAARGVNAWPPGAQCPRAPRCTGTYARPRGAASEMVPTGRRHGGWPSLRGSLCACSRGRMRLRRRSQRGSPVISAQSPSSPMIHLSMRAHLLGCAQPAGPVGHAIERVDLADEEDVRIQRTAEGESA